MFPYERRQIKTTNANMSKGYTDMFRWQRKKQREIKTRILTERITKEIKDFSFEWNDDDWSGTITAKEKDT